MKAGRELDALIAEKVFGWTDLHWVERYRNGCFLVPEGWYGKGPDGECYLTKSYSINIADAWLVVEKLQENDWEVVIETRSNQTEVKAKNRFGGWVDMYGSAETAPLAICLAALEACGVEVEG